MKILGVLCLVALASCGPVAQDESVVRLVARNFVDCANSDLMLCFKEHALRATEKFGTVRKLKIFDGITLLNSSPKEARSLDNLPSEPEERNKQVTERLWAAASDLLSKSELELSFAGSDDEEDDSRALNEVEESRGKKKDMKKKLKLLIPLLLLAKAKAVAIVVLSLVVIAASIFKLALLAKIAFIFKAIAILKALLAKKHQQHEEEVWVPHAEEHGHGGHGGWEGGWSRSKNDGGNLAYAAYRK